MTGSLLVFCLPTVFTSYAVEKLSEIIAENATHLSLCNSEHQKFFKEGGKSWLNNKIKEPISHIKNKTITDSGRNGKNFKNFNR